MSGIEDLPPPPEDAPTADDIRKRMAEIELAKAEKADAKRRRLAEEQEAQLRAFLEGGVTESDLERLRTRVAVAVEQGHTEIEVLRFPASLLTDRGRAINNHDPDWPTSLRGIAADYHAIYKQRAEPRGFGMHARVLSYPDGIPGEIALYLSWA